MREQPQWQAAGWVPLVAGIGWLLAGMAGSWVDVLVCLVPGVPLLATGGSKLLWPGDPRIQQFSALGGVLGVLVAIPGIFLIGFGPSLLLALLSAASFVAAGSVSVKQEPHFEEVPEPQPSTGLYAKVAIDDAILATMQLGMKTPSGDEAGTVTREVHEARELFGDRGWLEKPDRYHREPPPLDLPRLRSREARPRGQRLAYEHLTFESEYQPDPEEPGRARWLSYERNHNAHAWVLRKDSEEARPWLICIHGYQMGGPTIDMGAFDPRFLLDKMGVNALFPVLPLHGPRKMGRRSGDGFLAGNILDSVHGEAQAIWDIRRMIHWIQAQGAPAIGVHGLSLGGYNAALLASLSPDLECAIAGIPATDFARLVWRHAPPLRLQYMEHRGVVHDEVAEVLRVVSPLAIEPRVEKEGRAIYGGVADRLVPPDQVRDLWRHWDEPQLVWYQGGHLSFQREPAVRRLVKEMLRDRLLGGEAVAA